jgi:hypothetical protein
MGRLVVLLVLGLSAMTSAAVVSYGPVPGLTTSEEIAVTVNGESVWVEGYSSNFRLDQVPDWFLSQEYTRPPQRVNVANFSSSGAMEVEIRTHRPIESYAIRPTSRQIKSTRDGKLLRFHLPGPDKLYIEINGLVPLCLFANPPEENVPKATEENVVYFGPGVHRPGPITLKDNQTLYIAGGAVVYGSINGSPKHARVLGRGILDGEYQRRLVQLTKASEVRFEGVILRNGRSWQNTLTECDNIVYENVKVISFGNSGDGINPVGSRDVTIRHCFLRCTDDCIAIKAPGKMQTVDQIRVLDNTLIGYAFGDGVTIGFETNGPYIRNVLVKNCDILIARGGNRVDGHSAFSIICDGPSWITDVRYEDIRVEADVLKLFEVQVTDGTKYQDDPPGHIRSVYLKDIRWAADRPIILKGFDAQHPVEGVTFDNCSVADRPLRSRADASFQVNDHVRDVEFKPPETPKVQ